MKKGQIEAKISEAVSRFETEVIGKGPKYIKTTIIQDLIIIREGNVISLANRKLVENMQGVKKYKDYRISLFEASKEYLKDNIKKIIGCDIISTHYDLSTKTGETFIVMNVCEDLEGRFQKI